MSSLQKLQEKAAGLELQLATTRLIGYLFPESTMQESLRGGTTSLEK